MPKTLYVFDLENVQLPLVREKIEMMGDTYDYLLCFGYTQRMKNLPLVSSVEVLQADGTGHNYLDFQLTSELSIRANSGTYSEIIIVSNDTGFNAVANHLSRYTCSKVSRQGSTEFLKIKKPKKTTTIEPEPIVSTEDSSPETFSKAYVQNKLKFLISSKTAPSINKRLYNFALHTPSGGCIRTPKQWKELIKVEFVGMNPEKVYNALKKGGLIEKHSEKRNKLNLAKTEETVAILRTLK